MRNVEVDFLLRAAPIPTLLSAVAVEVKGEDCVVTMIRDLSAAKDAARKLEEKEAAQKAIFDASPDAISVPRISDGQIRCIND